MEKGDHLILPLFCSIVWIMLTKVDGYYPLTELLSIRLQRAYVYQRSTGNSREAESENGSLVVQGM